MRKIKRLNKPKKTRQWKYDPDEEASDRHYRRKEVNSEHADIMSEWCKENDWKLAIYNDNHHWKFTKEDVIVEWWPSSARFVVNKDYISPYHIFDVHQVEYMLSQIDSILQEF